MDCHICCVIELLRDRDWRQQRSVNDGDIKHNKKQNKTPASLNWICSLVHTQLEKRNGVREELSCSKAVNLAIKTLKTRTKQLHVCSYSSYCCSFNFLVKTKFYCCIRIITRKNPNPNPNSEVFSLRRKIFVLYARLAWQDLKGNAVVHCGPALLKCSVLFPRWIFETLHLASCFNSSNKEKQKIRSSIIFKMCFLLRHLGSIRDIAHSYFGTDKTIRVIGFVTLLHQAYVDLHLIRH